MIRYDDCRTLPVAELSQAWPGLVEKADIDGTGVALTAWQASALGARTLAQLPPENMIVTVPDFLHYGRLVNTGLARTIADLPGSLVRAGLAGSRSGLKLASHPLKAAKMDFWHFAEVLLRYDLALLPGSYRGAVLLHGHLTDFACVFGRETFVRGFFRAAGRCRQSGVHTQQTPAALTALAQWGLQPQVFSYLATPGDVAGESALKAAVKTGNLQTARLVAEIDSWPIDLQGPLGMARFSGAPADALLTRGSVTHQNQMI